MGDKKRLRMPEKEILPQRSEGQSFRRGIKPRRSERQRLRRGNANLCVSSFSPVLEK